MRVAAVAEYYPRPSHPGLGIWAHRQALGARGEGADVRVLALDRPLPPLGALAALGPGGGGPDLEPLREWARATRTQPRRATLDGIDVRYVRFLSPPRPLSYGNWGRWAAGPVGRALDALDRSWGVDLVHAHYAVPSGYAARRWIDHRRPGLPFVVSIHGGDLTYAAPRSERGRRAVAETLRAADAVLVNSNPTKGGVEELIGPRERLLVVHPGADVPRSLPEPHPEPTIVTVANLEPHKSQADVIRAFAALADRIPDMRYVLVGKGPDCEALEALASELGVGERVRFTGPLPHAQAVAEMARGHLHVMPSRHDGFGVAHIDAMACGVPSIGGAGTGADDIARAGEGIVMIEPGDVAELTRVIEALMSDSGRRERLGAAARETVERHFTWERNGRQTMEVYRSLVERPAS